jgi:hypothetical protein
VLQIATVQLREAQPASRCATSLRGLGAGPTIIAANADETIPMLNVRDECDLPDDDGYDLFTRETEFERYRRSPIHLKTANEWYPAVAERKSRSLRTKEFV